MLSISIVGRPWSGLFKPLEFDQAAPVGFLVLAKLAVSALRASEYALRFVINDLRVSVGFYFGR